MPTLAEGDPETFAATLVTDQHRAEALLAELATDLCRVPVDERTGALHLRALALKRHVMRWPEDHPDEAVRRAVVDEVLAMQRETRDWMRLTASRRLGRDEHSGVD